MTSILQKLNDIIYTSFLGNLLHILSLDSLQNNFQEIDELKAQSIKLLPKLPHDSKILILGNNLYQAKNLAASLYLETSQWVYIKSIAFLSKYDKHKSTIVLAPDFYNNLKAQDIIRWANRKGYDII